MALALESVFRPPEPASQAIPNRRSGTEGNGKEFADTLSRTRGSQTSMDDDGAVSLPQPQSTAAIHFLPADAGSSELTETGLAVTEPNAPDLIATNQDQLAPEATGLSGSAPATTGLDDANVGESELATDRKRALSHEEDVQSAPPTLVVAAIAPPQTAGGPAAAAGPTVPETTASENTQQAVGDIASVEADGTTLAAAVGAPKAVTADETGPVRAPVASRPGKAETSPDTHSLRDAENVDKALAVATPATTDSAMVTAMMSGDRPASDDATGQSASGAPVMSIAAHTPSAVQTTATSIPLPTGMTATNAMLVASPADVVDIVSSAADDGQSDSIVIQLDPPELGRVSIDFKFDAHGLQHVTVTGESPEAMRQLRLMHFELTQALERHGIGSSNMTFQQQQQNAQQSPTPNPFARQPLMGDLSIAQANDPLIAANSPSSPRTLPGGRLDMKL